MKQKHWCEFLGLSYEAYLVWTQGILSIFLFCAFPSLNVLTLFSYISAKAEIYLAMCKLKSFRDGWGFFFSSFPWLVCCMVYKCSPLFFCLCQSCHALLHSTGDHNPWSSKHTCHSKPYQQHYKAHTLSNWCLASSRPCLRIPIITWPRSSKSSSKSLVIVSCPVISSSASQCMVLFVNLQKISLLYNPL